MSNPATLGKYKILKTLGKGGMGTVYLGFDAKLQRHVAIKTIRREEVGNDEIAAEYARRFELEAKAIAMLKHPNIVAVHDFGEEAEIAYMVMEFVEGHDLKYYFDNKIEFSLAEIQRLTNDLLEALAHAHDKGVWHRDIKPANVMIDVTGQVKLTDFGVSRINDNNEHTRTTNTQVGTLYYMSPEQVLNSGISQRSDIFAAGVILYQFLTGVRPFTGSDFEVSNKIVREMPTRPSQLNPSLSQRVDLVLETAMAKLPEHRYASAREFATALKQALGDKQEPLFDMDATRHFYAAQGSKNSIDPLPTSRGSFPAASQSAASQRNTASQTSASENAEIEFWRSIKDGSDIDEFRLYLAHFPQGTYAALARMRIERLTGPSTQAGNASLHALPPLPSPPAANTTPPNTAQGASGKLEPSFSDFANTSSVATPARPPSNSEAAQRPKWLLPSLILLLLMGAAFGLWLALQKPTAAPTPEAKPIANALTTNAPLHAAPSQPSASPANPSPTTSASPQPDIDAEQKKLEALRAESRQLEIKKQKEALELAKAEKLKREEEASKRAIDNIQRSGGTAGNNEQAKTSSTTGKGDVCPAQASYNAAENGKPEAVCAELKGKVEKWIARWKTPEGTAKGQDKFQEPQINQCTCQPAGECVITVGYLRPCA